MVVPERTAAMSDAPIESDDWDDWDEDRKREFAQAMIDGLQAQ